MNSVTPAANAGQVEVRSLDILWREVLSLKPTKVYVEAPAFLKDGIVVEVSVVFGDLGGSNLRLRASKEGLSQSLDDILTQATQFGKRPQ